MPPTTRIFLLLGSLFGAFGVILGAFGAHALRGKLPDELLATWQTAVLYHLVHALGLIAVSFAASLLPGSSLVRWAGWTMTAGILLFSGSLYVLCLSGVRALGAVTPFGGIAFIAAWLLLTAAAWQS
jgi:uncharacterized membrane protein YgdD (TMEM256/DUF423 family)